MKLPLNINLTDKVAVITGAGGVLCSAFSKALAQCGAKVAVLDLNEAAAQKVADEITAEGNKAIAVKVNCLDSASLNEAHDKVVAAFGPCDILINGAGGNNPRGTTDDEQFDAAVEGVKTFFDLDPAGVRFVFDLNVIAALMTTQVFAKDMIGRGGNIMNVSSMNAFRPLTKIPAYSGAKSAVSNFTQWLADLSGQEQHPRQRHCARLLCDQSEPRAALHRGRQAHRPHRQDPGRDPHGTLRRG